MGWGREGKGGVHGEEVHIRVQSNRVVVITLCLVD